MSFTTSVFCTAQFEASHRWKDIPPESPVQYLFYMHRHVFHVRLEVAVEHSDRDVEFFELKIKLRQFINKWDMGLGELNKDRLPLREQETHSCEQYAEEIWKQFDVEYGGKYNVRSVTVSEDNENGATLTTTSTKEV